MIRTCKSEISSFLPVDDRQFTEVIPFVLHLSAASAEERVNVLVTSRDRWNFGNHQGPLGHIKGLSQSIGEREKEKREGK